MRNKASKVEKKNDLWYQPIKKKYKVGDICCYDKGLSLVEIVESSKYTYYYVVKLENEYEYWLVSEEDLKPYNE